MLIKICNRCNLEKEITLFHKNKKGKYGRKSICAKCCNIETISRYEENKQEWNKKSLISYYKIKYGLSVEEVKNRILERDGKCDICGLKPNKTLHIDHDHNTNEVRGMLCFNCNGGLGQFKDSVVLLRRAVDYLDDFNKK